MNATHEKPERTFWYTLARGFAWLMFHTVCPVRYHGRQNIENARAPFMLLSNHKCWLDPLAIVQPCKRYELRILGKRELARGKLAGYVLGKLHMIAIDRHNTDIAGMRGCYRALKDGRALCIFPEGTRHLPELMQEVETGFAALALREQTPLLPVYIAGKIAPFKTTHIYFGAPLDVTDIYALGTGKDAVDALVQRIKDTFFSMRDAAV